ncbi:class I SAM-dependent methyltransferase [Amycolatopsis sp. NPDC050768]|uniref:class I SAM-dependent methyltransferase n=1 Tax=Amycolatopsis sp. NPDC050768 TaxID=3154839 RepID=UPI0033BFD357
MTPDGCPADLHLRPPAAGEPEIVHGAVPTSAGQTPALLWGAALSQFTQVRGLKPASAKSVDNSGCAEPSVDNPCPAASRVYLLAGDRPGLTPWPAVSRICPWPTGLLAAARRHLAPGGRLLVEWHPPEWFDHVADGPGGLLGEVAVSLHDVVREGDLLSVAVRYRAAERVWHQEFTCRRLGFPELSEALTSADLTFGEWLTADRDWFSARGVADQVPI